MKLSTSKAGQLFQHQLNLTPHTVKPFGAGHFSETLYISDQSGKEYIMRVAPPDTLLQIFYEYRMMRQEPAIHSRLLNDTSVPVPEIIDYNFGRQMIDRDFLIMNKLPGVPLNEARLAGEATHRAFKEWGAYINQVHSLTEPGNQFGYVGSHRPMKPQSGWQSAFHIMYRKLLNDIRKAGIYDDETYQYALHLLEANLDLFTHCSTSCLCHGDIWITNVLVDEQGRVTGVIDFDRACWGDVEWDLAIAEYCGVTKASFWEGYGEKIDTHSGEANIRRMFYLLYEHQKYIIIALSERRNDPQGAGNYAKESLSIMEQFSKTGQVPV